MPTMPTSNSDINTGTPIDMRKGRRVLLAGAGARQFKNYEGAWIDLSGKATATLTPVLILLSDGSYTTYRPKHYNIKEYNASPSNRVQAATIQHPRIDEMMQGLVRYLAKCNIETKDDDGEIIKYFADALDKANKQQKSMGPAADYKQVIWPLQMEGNNDV